MGDYLSEFVNHFLNAQADGEAEELKAARFTVAIDPISNRRLDFIANKLDVRKAELVRRAIDCLIYEFEDKLGLSIEPREDNEYFNAIFRSGGGFSSCLRRTQGGCCK